MTRATLCHVAHASIAAGVSMPETFTALLALSLRLPVIPQSSSAAVIEPACCLHPYQ